MSATRLRYFWIVNKLTKYSIASSFSGSVTVFKFAKQRGMGDCFSLVVKKIITFWESSDLSQIISLRMPRIRIRRELVNLLPS